MFLLWLGIPLLPTAVLGSLNGRHIPKIEAKFGGLFIDGQPFSPNGYCTHGHLTGSLGNHKTRSYEIEVKEVSRD